MHRPVILVALGMFLLGSVPLASAQTWSIQYVDVGGARAGSTSLGLASVGGKAIPVISYFAAPRNLNVAILDPVALTWGLIRADAGGEFNSVDVDAFGTVHAAYLDGATGALKYWRYAAGAATQQVDTDVASVNSLRVDGNGIPHISYWRSNSAGIPTPDRVKVADYGGGAWTPSFADPQSPRGRYNSLVVDPSGNPAVAYYDAGTDNPPTLYSRRLRIGVRVSGNWSYDVVDSVGDPGRFNSVQAFGNPPQQRVSYLASGSSMLRYAQFNGSSWTLQDVASVGAIGNSSETSLAIDSGGNPHIAYYDSDSSAVMYASRTGASTWTTERVDGVGAGGGYVFLRLDTNFTPNRAILSYYDAGTNTLKIAYRGYPDADGDGIPDPYDAHQGDPDFNKNKIPDGQEGGVLLNAPGVPRLKDEPIFGCASITPPAGGAPPPADLLLLLGPAAYALLRRRARA